MAFAPFIESVSMDIADGDGLVANPNSVFLDVVNLSMATKKER
jgi:hypothetical protein